MGIHIVEDDPGVRDSLLLLLRQLGHDARAYPDAEMFMTSTIPVPEDTVIVDLALPGMQGPQLIRWMQQLRTPPRIIAISGQSQSHLDRALKGLDVSTLLRKPLSIDAIGALL